MISERRESTRQPERRRARDIKMTQRYAHLAPEHLRAEMERTAAPVRSAATAPNPASMAQQMAQSDTIETVSSVK
jgi:hypothetical protein